MDWYHPQLGLVSVWAAFVLNDIQYPVDWLIRATSEERAERGFLPVLFDPRPNDQFYIVSQNAPVVSGGVAIVSWTSTPRDLEQLQSGIVSSIKTIAGSIISTLGVDWKLSRAEQQRKLREQQISSGVPEADAQVVQEVPLELLELAQAIRNTGNEAEEKVLSCTSVEELEALPAPEWPRIV